MLVLWPYVFAKWCKMLSSSKVQLPVSHLRVWYGYVITFGPILCFTFSCHNSEDYHSHLKLEFCMDPGLSPTQPEGQTWSC